MDWNLRLREFVDELKARADVYVIRARLAKPVAEKVLAKADLDRELAQLYSQMNGCSLAWEFLELKRTCRTLVWRDRNNEVVRSVLAAKARSSLARFFRSSL